MDQNNIKNELILIVDDIPENLQLLGNFLRESNYKVAFATSGFQALTVLNSVKPDLILLDITMPEMDGFTVCKKIKENIKLADIPIIFLTAHTNKDDVVKGFEIGGVDYVTKPFNSSELIARIKTHLELKKSKEKIVEQNKNLITLNANLEELVSSRDKFYSIIAHDLRSPFNSILGFLELIKNEYPNLSEKEKVFYIESIFDSAKTLHNLLENLLTWIRSQSGKLVLQPQSINLVHLTEDIIQIYLSNFEKKSISYKLEYSESANIFADYDTISTVIRNLISNAIKFTPKNGHILIDISINEDYATLMVSDSGIGMSEDEISRVFIPGKKIVKFGTEKESGTGLGLILTKEFVEKNGGKIWVTSIKDKRSKFYFTIPRKNSETT